MRYKGRLSQLENDLEEYQNTVDQLKVSHQLQNSELSALRKLLNEVEKLLAFSVGFNYMFLCVLNFAYCNFEFLRKSVKVVAYVPNLKLIRQEFYLRKLLHVKVLQMKLIYLAMNSSLV